MIFILATVDIHIGHNRLFVYRPIAGLFKLSDHIRITLQKSEKCNMQLSDLEASANDRHV